MHSISKRALSSVICGGVAFIANICWFGFYWLYEGPPAVWVEQLAGTRLLPYAVRRGSGRGLGCGSTGPGRECTRGSGVGGPWHGSASHSASCPYWSSAFKSQPVCTGRDWEPSGIERDLPWRHHTPGPRVGQTWARARLAPAPALCVEVSEQARGCVSLIFP